MNRRALPTRRLRCALTALLIGGLVLAGCGPTPVGPGSPARERGTLGDETPSSRAARGAAGVGSPSTRLEPATETPAGLSSDDWTVIREQIERDRYRIETGSGGDGSRVAYHAANPAQRLRLGFGPDGITASLLRGEPSWSWSWGLRLAGWGYGADQQAVSSAEPVADENRVEYRRGPLTEWYGNERRGLQQGFTLLEPPPTDPGAGRLRLEFAVSGDLAPRLADDGHAILWQDAAGQAVLRYSRLAAWDAGARALPVALGLTPQGLWLEVDDRAAEYPLTIDPFIQQAELEPRGLTGASFAGSVAVDGDTALVGAPSVHLAEKVEQGAAYVFVRSGTAWSLQQRLTALDGAAGDVFGFSVALSGNTALVGAPGSSSTGAAYVLVRSGANWAQQQKLTPADGVGGDEFGRAVALSGDTALIGAQRAKVGANFSQGAAYVFVRSGTAWAQQGPRLVAADGAEQDFFGASVAVSGNTALVGAVFAAVNGQAFQGAAYVFVRSGTIWSFQQKLTADDGTAQEQFGQSVAVSGDTALVGTGTATVDGRQSQGAAYVFVRIGTTWTQQQKLTAADGAAFHSFGDSVALSGETALIGAHRASVDQSSNPGAAYVFVRSGTTWTFQQKLVASDGADRDIFGIRVALSGETALIAAPNATVGGDQDEGAAYVFVRSGTAWAQQQELVRGESRDLFGQSVALSGDLAVVGAPTTDFFGKANQGAAYVFVRDGTTWALQQRLIQAFADGATGDNFGQSVALAGETALIGVPGVKLGLNDDQGAAYVFVRNGTTWVQQQKLTAADGAAGDQFGFGVALSGETALVGAFVADVGGQANRGAAYAFVRNGTSWAQQGPRLVAADGAANDVFGVTVALDGDTALIGASGVDVGGRADQGAAYVFVRSGATWAQQGPRLLAGDGSAGDQLGEAVALSGDTALIGAFFADVGGNANQGAAYVFVRSNGIWTEQQKLTQASGDGAASDNFGDGVGLSGDTALIGVPGLEVGGKVDRGAAYRFVRDGTTWTERQQLTAANGAAGDTLGRSVALSGDIALAGAPGADVAGSENRGVAYVFASDDTPTPTATASATATPTATATITPAATATATPIVDPSVTPTATPTFVACKDIKPKIKAKLRKGTRTYDLTIDPKSFARPCTFVRAVVTWGDGSPPETLTVLSATHTYSAAGQFTVAVRLTDTGGHVDVPAKPKKLKVK